MQVHRILSNQPSFKAINIKPSNNENKQKKDTKSTDHVLCGMLATFCTLALLEIGYVVKKDIDLYHKMDAIERTPKDTIKLSKIRPVVNDTIQAVPKIIK